METTGDTDEGVQDEIAVLDRLESDLAAVEQAIERLDHISAEDVEGEIAASRIDAAVSAERFGSAPVDPTRPVDQPGEPDQAVQPDQPIQSDQSEQSEQSTSAGSAEVADDASPSSFG